MIDLLMEKFKDKKYIGIDLKENDIDTVKTYNIKIKNISVELNLVTIKHDLNNPYVTRKTILKYIKAFIDYFEDKIGDEYLKLYILPTNIPKVFPSSNLLAAKHVNNGWTQIRENRMENKVEKEIVIYRSEDVYKVLIHELIHYFKLDLSYGFMVNDYHNFYKIHLFHYSDRTINLNEAYTETLACFLYVEFKYTKQEDKINALERQNKWFIHLMNKLIQHAETNGRFIEESNGYSYYIARAILFDNIEKFNETLKTPYDRAKIEIMKDILSNVPQNKYDNGAKYINNWKGGKKTMKSIIV